MREIQILAVPYELGRLRDGVGRGAEALLAGGAEDALASAGSSVRTELIELDPRYRTTGVGDVDASFALIGSVAERVRQAREQEAFPVVLGGSCFLSVGVVAGLAEPDPGVVWFDAHSDFNHPDTAVSGYFDGMGLSVLTGGAWQGMLAAVPGARPVQESSVILAGSRDFDPPEETRLRASEIVQLPPDRLRSPDALVAAVEALPPGLSGLYLHLDLDVLDAAVAGVNVYSAPNGLDADELEELAGAIAARSPVHALSLTCYDPAYDADRRVPPIACRILETIARNL